jgi:hypothetical protein
VVAALLPDEREGDAADRGLGRADEHDARAECPAGAETFALEEGLDGRTAAHGALVAGGALEDKSPGVDDVRRAA